ncbi:MAG TPA: LysR family transcriptional regulator [Advenella sp.]|nr:LysR family transcriptional regulator [Advenella sp.]
MSRALSFPQIEAFKAVVLTGTTVAAARMLHTTQPTVSRLLSQAQSATGLKLLVNDRGRLQLTREGRHLFEIIQANFQGLGRIEQAVAALRESGAGVFRVAATPSLGQSLLPAAMERFARHYPQVRFNVQTLGRRQIEDGLRLGLYDIALTNSLPDGAEFEGTAVHKSQAVCVSSQDHPFAKRDYVSLADLNDQVLISLPGDDVLEMALQDAFNRKGMVHSTKIETIYTSTICIYASRGLGVGIVNPYMASVFRDRLCIRNFRPKIRVTTYAVFARFMPQSELAQHFLQNVVESCEAEQFGV